MSMTSYIRLYKVNSMPLEEAINVFENDIVYSSTGKCFECIGKDESGSAIYEQVHESELVDGELLENIEDNSDLLALFWKLSSKRLSKVKDYASKD